jgi:4-amino-4-deoxy-L-arabinose transferase-like glycosyltransferase
MLSNAASRAPQIGVATPYGVLSALLQLLGQCFQLSMPAERARVAHLWWLAALTCAGVFLRFWGLGAVGLHGDEETMAMAVRHILEDGRPLLPSGMFYPRGLTQLYLMAGSVAVLGETEWALRLPSVLCGSALIPLAYVIGRRFLRPQWKHAFAADIAFLPDLIVDSKTALM